MILPTRRTIKRLDPEETTIELLLFLDSDFVLPLSLEIDAWSNG